MSLTLRLTKGSELTYSELDGNFSFLDNKIDTLETDLFAARRSGNYVINGDFRVWQRGTTFSSAGYTADRWEVTTNTNDSRTVRINATTPTSTIDPLPKNYLVWVNTAGDSGTINRLGQRIEDVHTLNGQEVTLSFWARAGTGESYSVTPFLTQSFGSGGSSNVNYNLGAKSIDATWTKYTSTTTLGDLSGKTIGADSYLWLRFELPTNANFTLNVANVKLEVGDTATDFEPRPLQQEVALCERYFQKSYDLDTDPGTANSHFGVLTGYFDGAARSSDDNHDLMDMSTQFRTRMRASPTIILYNPNAGTSGEVLRTISSGSETYDAGAIANTSGFSVTMEDANWSSDFVTMTCHYTAEAEL